MAYRITTYQQAFEYELGVKLDPKMKAFLARMERDGHTEKSICFAVWKKRDKLVGFKHDSRFMSILENEINKWSWKKDDPRWQEYWKRKNEEKQAVAIRKEIDAARTDDYEAEMINNRADRPTKRTVKRNTTGYVYFIQGLCGGAIKIGYSVEPEARMRELQTGYPDTLTILLMIPAGEHTEATLHRQLEASRLKGEWFRPDKAVIDKIKELAAKYKRDQAAESGESLNPTPNRQIEEEKQ